MRILKWASSTHPNCKLFANFLTLNQTTDQRHWLLMVYGRNARLSKKLWKQARYKCYCRGQRQSLIARSGRRKIKGLSWIKFRNRTRWKVWVRFCSITEQNQMIRITCTFVYRNFRMSTLETINIIPRNKMVATHLTDALLIVCPYIWNHSSQHGLRGRIRPKLASQEVKTDHPGHKTEWLSSLVVKVVAAGRTHCVPFSEAFSKSTNPLIIWHVLNNRKVI